MGSLVAFEQVEIPAHSNHSDSAQVSHTSPWLIATVSIIRPRVCFLSLGSASGAAAMSAAAGQGGQLARDLSSL